MYHIPQECGVRIRVLSKEEQFNTLRNNSYFKYVIDHSKTFSDFLKCEDVSNHLLEFGYKAYNYKAYWEMKGLSFREALMIYLLSKIEPFSNTVGNVNDHWVPEDEWVVTMSEKSFIRMAFRLISND